MKYVLKTGWFFAFLTSTWASGLLICLTNRMPNFTAGNTAATMLFYFVFLGSRKNVRQWKNHGDPAIETAKVKKLYISHSIGTSVRPCVDSLSERSSMKFALRSPLPTFSKTLQHLVTVRRTFTPIERTIAIVLTVSGSDTKSTTVSKSDRPISHLRNYFEGQRTAILSNNTVSRLLHCYAIRVQRMYNR